VKKYEVIIFDADHTVIDYTQDERAALRKLLPSLGIAPTKETLDECNQISVDAWVGAGLNEVHTEYIQREYHNLYHRHVKRIFEGIFAKYPCEADPQEVGLKFAKLLESPAVLCEGAAEVLPILSKKYQLCIATNGMTEMQYGRLREIGEYFTKLYISEEMGVIKPLPAFFDIILQELGVEREACLMVGDSLSSDICGANASGIDSCWLNRRGVKNESGILPTYEIRSLKELLSML
jgi:HAD superfamily hydrolase (TIGR01549 family)